MSRLLVQETVFETFISKLKTRLQRLRVGNGLDKTCDIGALVCQEDQQRLVGLVEEARKHGAEVGRFVGNLSLPALYFYMVSSGAFVTDHNILINKHQCYGVKSYLNNRRQFKSYLNNRRQYVLYNKADSKYDNYMWSSTRIFFRFITLYFIYKQ